MLENLHVHSHWRSRSRDGRQSLFLLCFKVNGIMAKSGKRVWPLTGYVLSPILLLRKSMRLMKRSQEPGPRQKEKTFET